jgi:hypothetical protein
LPGRGPLPQVRVAGTVRGARRGRGLRAGAAGGAVRSELRSDGKLKHAPPWTGREACPT